MIPPSSPAVSGVITGEPENANINVNDNNNLEKKTLISQGAAADIWLVESLVEPITKRVSKTIRVDEKTIERYRHPRSKVDVKKLWKVFVDDLEHKSMQWSSAHHQNVVQVFGLRGGLDLRVEYCSNGSACQFLESLQSSKIEHRRKMILEVVKGVAYLHAQDPPILHGSINLNKLFVDDKGTTKVGEFGLAMLTEHFSLLAPSVSHEGLGRWRSPELVNSDSKVVVPTAAADVWALGCTLFEIVSGNLPYSEYQHELRVRREVLTGKPPGRREHCLGSELHNFWPFLEMCWSFLPEDRPTATFLDRSLSSETLDFGSGAISSDVTDTGYGNKTKDIDQSIAQQSQALLVTSPDQTDHPVMLSKLGNLCQLRFTISGELADLNKAIDSQSQAVKLVPVDHPDRSSYLGHLGCSYRLRFDRLKERADIDQSIEFQSQALQLTPDGHPDRSIRLINLSRSYRDRYEHLGDPADLIRADEYSRRAMLLPVEVDWPRDLDHSNRHRIEEAAYIDRKTLPSSGITPIPRYTGNEAAKSGSPKVMRGRPSDIDNPLADRSSPISQSLAFGTALLGLQEVSPLSKILAQRRSKIMDSESSKRLPGKRQGDSQGVLDADTDAMEDLEHELIGGDNLPDAILRTKPPPEQDPVSIPLRKPQIPPPLLSYEPRARPKLVPRKNKGYMADSSMLLPSHKREAVSRVRDVSPPPRPRSPGIGTDLPPVLRQPGSVKGKRVYAPTKLSPGRRSSDSPYGTLSPPSGPSEPSSPRPGAHSPSSLPVPSRTIARGHQAGDSVSSIEPAAFRDEIRAAASFIVKELSQQPPQIKDKDWIEVEMRLRPLVRAERVWEPSGAGSQLGLPASGLRGAERERRVFGDALRDGVVLCHLMNKLRPGIIPKVGYKEDGSRNIQNFRYATARYGADSLEMFEDEDLLENTPEGMGNVANALLYLAQLIEEERQSLVVIHDGGEAKPPPYVGASRIVGKAGPVQLDEGPVRSPLRPGGLTTLTHQRRSATSIVTNSSLMTESTTAFSSLLGSRSVGHGTMRTTTTEATSLSSGIPAFSRSKANEAAKALLLTESSKVMRRRLSAIGNPMPDRSSPLSQSPEDGASGASRRGRRSFEAPIDVSKRVAKKWPDDFDSALDADTTPIAELGCEPMGVDSSSRTSLQTKPPPELVPISIPWRKADTLPPLLSDEPRPLRPILVPRRSKRYSADSGVLSSPRESLALGAAQDDSPSSVPESSGMGIGRPPVLRQPSGRDGKRIYVPKGYTPPSGEISDRILVQRVSPSGARPSPQPAGQPSTLQPVPFPRAASAEWNSPSRLPTLPSPSETLRRDAEKDEKQPGPEPRRPNLPRGRHQSEFDSQRKKIRPGSMDEIGVRRSRIESMLEGVRSEERLAQSPPPSRGQIPRRLVVVKEEGRPAVHYSLGECIGKGQFGLVYRALNLTTGQIVAVKQLALGGLSRDEVKNLKKEVDLLKSLSHPSIVKYEGMAQDEEYLSIILEYVENGSLGQTLKAFGKLNERLVASYVIRILEGLHYLHQSSVVHCDLKAANILTTKHGNVKLSDFGVSLNLHAMEKVSEVAGTPNWMAPEVIELKGASTKSDIWSLGCVIIELLTGRPPYGDIPNGLTVMFRIVEDESPPIPEGVSPMLRNFLELCFNKDPDCRPSAAILFEHPWLEQKWGAHKELRPQDSIPFLRRVSADLQRSEAARHLAASLDPTLYSASVLEDSPHSPPSRPPITIPHPGDEPTLEHHFSANSLSKPADCNVCYEPIRKHAWICDHCRILVHSRCKAESSAIACERRVRTSHDNDSMTHSSTFGVLSSSSTSHPETVDSPSAYRRILGNWRKRASATTSPELPHHPTLLSSARPLSITHSRDSNARADSRSTIESSTHQTSSTRTTTTAANASVDTPELVIRQPDTIRRLEPEDRHHRPQGSETHSTRPASDLTRSDTTGRRVRKGRSDSLKSDKCIIQ